MNFANGYRLKIKGIREFSGVLDGFRSDATKIFAREYGRLVAADAVRRLDLATIGHRETAGSNPIQDANEAMSKAYVEKIDGFPKLACELSVYFVNDAVLVVLEGGEKYRNSWEARKEVVKWGWNADVGRPRGVSEQRWKTREIYWRGAVTRPGIGSCLKFSLIDGQPPQIGWNGIRRLLPRMEDRIKTILLEMQKEEGRSQLSKADLADMKRKLATTIVRDVEKTHLLSYDGVKNTSKPERPATSRTPEAPRQRDTIDHADIVQASDGRIFVAVPFVGLDQEDRVFLQVADGEIVITQNAKQFGHVGNVSRAAVDLLRECKTVVMVEVETFGGKRLLRAKHVAIVKDISLTENVSRLFGQWRFGKGKKSRNDGEISQWDSQQ